MESQGIRIVHLICEGPLSSAGLRFLETHSVAKFRPRCKGRYWQPMAPNLQPTILDCARYRPSLTNLPFEPRNTQWYYLCLLHLKDAKHRNSI